MNNELKWGGVDNFLHALQEVFYRDWKYTQEQSGILDETEVRQQNNSEMGLEVIHFISPAGTFVNPGVEVEAQDWGNRAILLERYRELKTLLLQG